MTVTLSLPLLFELGRSASVSELANEIIPFSKTNIPLEKLLIQETRTRISE